MLVSSQLAGEKTWPFATRCNPYILLLLLLLSRTLPSHHKLTYHDLYSVLQKYANCQQRFGK